MKKASILLLLLLGATPVFADGLSALGDAYFYFFLFALIFILTTLYLLLFFVNYKELRHSSIFNTYSFVNLILCLLPFIFIIKEAIRKSWSSNRNDHDLGAYLLLYGYPIIGIVANIYAIRKHRGEKVNTIEPSYEQNEE